MNRALWLLAIFVVSYKITVMEIVDGEEKLVTKTIRHEFMTRKEAVRFMKNGCSMCWDFKLYEKRQGRKT